MSSSAELRALFGVAKGIGRQIVTHAVDTSRMACLRRKGGGVGGDGVRGEEAGGAGRSTHGQYSSSGTEPCAERARDVRCWMCWMRDALSRGDDDDDDVLPITE